MKSEPEKMVGGEAKYIFYREERRDKISWEENREKESFFERLRRKIRISTSSLYLETLLHF